MIGERYLIVGDCEVFEDCMMDYVFGLFVEICKVVIRYFDMNLILGESFGSFVDCWIFGCIFVVYCVL